MTLSATDVERLWYKRNEGWTDMGWGEEGNARKSLDCKFLRVGGVPWESIPTDCLCSQAFPVIHYWPHQRCFPFSWGSGCNTAYTEVAFKYTCIRWERAWLDYVSAKKWGLFTIKMWRWCCWRCKVQKWMVGHRREAHMMAKRTDKFLYAGSSVAVTFRSLLQSWFFFLQLSPFALCLWIFSFTKAASLHLGE